MRSFLIPGFILVSLLNYIFNAVGWQNIFTYENDLSSNIVMLGLSVFFGVLLQAISEFLKTTAFYKKISV